MSNSSKTISWRFFPLLLILIFLVIAFLRTPKACQEPLTYRIGKVDERFDLSRQEFGVAVGMAAAMWGKPFYRDLFCEDPDGVIEINLLYDYRQEASDRLKKLNYKIDRSKIDFHGEDGASRNAKFTAVALFGVK